MIIKNLKLTLRRFGRQKLNTILHVIGLTLSMSVCLLIGLFISNELNFDKHHFDVERTYRINSQWINVDKKSFHFSTPMPMGEALRTDIPELKKVAQVHPMYPSIVEINIENRFMEDRILLAEPEYLDVFNIEILKGAGKEALRKPYQAFLTESTAEKLFGKKNPVGQTFKLNNKHIITVAGIIEDFQGNTHLPATMLLSYFRNDEFLGTDPSTWTNVSGTCTFIIVPENISLANIDSRLKAIADKHINGDPNLPKNFRHDFVMQPLQKIHFEAKWGGGGPWIKAVNTMWLWFFGCVGLAVLLLACINFVNLSTAQALTRAKEVGVRKTMGAGVRQLISQFMTEAWLLALVSGILAMLITYACLPGLNKLVDKKISFDIVQSAGLLVALAVGIFLTGILAGLYPAWLIARFNAVNSLKSGFTAGNKRSSALRKVLVVTQFTISISLLIALTVISQQVNFFRTRDLGFDKDNIVNVDIKTPENSNVFAAELKRIPQVKDFSFATATPSNEGHWGSIMSLTNGDDPARQEVTMIMGDDHFSPMYGLQLLSGRFPAPHDTNFLSESIPPEKQISKVLVNEKLIKALGFGTPANALGKRFWFGMGSGNAEIIGVVSDFNTNSLHELIKPTLLFQVPHVYNQAGIRIEAGSNLPSTIAAIEKAWKKTYPDGVFNYKFLDEQINAFYKTESRLFVLFKIFAGLAMLISCLGLWGLVTFAAQRRTKEIGIRKVLGASVTGITALLSREFLQLILLAIVIAIPISWWGMQSWLQDFAYRINIGWWVFGLAGVIAIFISMITVSYQAIKAALSNPVKSLRTE